MQPQNIVDGIAETFLVPNMMVGSSLSVLTILYCSFFNSLLRGGGGTDLRKTIRIYFAFFCRFSFSFHTIFSCGNKSVYILHRERSFAFLIFNSQQNTLQCSRKLIIIGPLDLKTIHAIKPSD